MGVIKRVLITGGAGFIGFHLAGHLASQGQRVSILDNFARGEEDSDFQELIGREGVEFIKGDITKAETFDNLRGEFDYVYHLAAINGTENFYNIPDEVLKVGALGTLNVLDWFVKQEKGKLLFSSSSETYAGGLKVLGERFPVPSPEEVPLVIDDVENVRYSYGVGKMLGEVAFHSYAKRYGMDRFSIVRYHNIYGPRMGNEHVIPQFIERAMSSEGKFKISGRGKTRTFCYVEDGVRATQMVMESGETDGKTVHIGRDDDEIEIVDLARRVLRVAGVEKEIDVVESGTGSVARRCPNISKLRALGFSPRVVLEEGLRRTFDWYRVHRKGADLGGVGAGQGGVVPGVIREQIIKDFQGKKEFIPGETRIKVAESVFDYREVLGVLEAYYSGRISEGPKTKEFEESFANYIGTKYSVATNSGSSANLLVLNALVQAGQLKKGDEVIVPAATFATVASPIVQLGLVPVFVDVEERSYNIDPDEVRKALGERTRVLMPVHSMGLPADMGRLLEIARERALIVLEDCCEAHGAEYKGRKVGTMGDVGTFSFFVAHNMTTGDGGMVVTNSEELSDRVRSIKTFGRALGKEEFDSPVLRDYPYLKDYNLMQTFLTLGYNMRLPNPIAAFGVEQLKKLDGFNDIRRDNASFFSEKLREFDRFIQLPSEGEGSKHVYYGYPIIIRRGAGFSRKELEDFLRARGVDSRPFFGGCLPDQPAFKGEEIRVVGELPVSRWIRDYGFFIGIHPWVGREEREWVVGVFREFFKERGNKGNW